MIEDTYGLDIDDEENNDAGFESDEESDERVEVNVNRLEIDTDSNFPNWGRIENEEDKIANEQG